MLVYEYLRRRIFSVVYKNLIKSIKRATSFLRIHKLWFPLGDAFLSFQVLYSMLCTAPNSLFHNAIQYITCLSNLVNSGSYNLYFLPI